MDRKTVHNGDEYTNIDNTISFFQNFNFDTSLVSNCDTISVHEDGIHASDHNDISIEAYVGHMLMSVHDTITDLCEEAYWNNVSNDCDIISVREDNIH